MTKYQSILLAILSAAVAGVLYKFVPDQGVLATGLAGLAIYLVGYAKQNGDDARAIAAAKAKCDKGEDAPPSPPEAA